MDYNIYAEFIRVLKKPNVFIWLSRDQIYDTLKWFHDNTKSRFQILVWCKTNPFPACNGNWLSDIEYCIHFYDGIKLNPGIRHKHKFYVSATNANGKKKYHHPTVKPLELVKMHLEHASQPNDIVLDCFIGSGTTAVACKELGRHFIGYEINKDYYQIAIDRLNGIDKSGQLTI